MKIKTVLVIIVMLSPMSLYAEAERGSVSGSYKVEDSKKVYRNGRITLNIQTGLANGEAHELVYSGSDKISELTWDIKNVFMAGGNITAVLYRPWGLKFNAGISSMVKKQDSIMDDYDWFIINGPWTDWSHENATLEKALTIDVSLSKSILSDDSGSFNMDVELGFKRENWKWVSFGGTYIYSVFGFRDATGTFPNVPGISYEQTINTPFIGASASFRKADFSLFLRVVGSPFVFTEAVDYHYSRGLVFTDTFSSGKMIGLDLSLAYHMSENMSVNINYFYQQHYRNRGDTVTYNQATGAQTYDPNNAGMSLTYQTIGIDMTYSF